MEQALESAARQIVQREYVTELETAVFEPIHAFVAVFDGKEARSQLLDGLHGAESAKS